MRLKQALSLANGIQRHLSRHGETIEIGLLRDAVAVGLGDVSWASYKKKVLTPEHVAASDFRPTPSLEVLHYLGRELGDDWGTALTSSRSFGKLFIIVADNNSDAEQALVSSRTVLQLKGRSVQSLDFSDYSSRDEVEDAFSAMTLSGGDTAVLTGLQDVEDYDTLWSLLRSNWQVLVTVEGASALSRLFARTSLTADDKPIGRMLGLKRDAQTSKLLTYLY